MTVPCSHHPVRCRSPLADSDRGQHGFVGGAEVLPFGVLIFVVGTLLVANAWAVVDAKLAAQAAARETARSYVESDGSAAAVDEATEQGRQAVAGMGRDPDRLELTLEGGPFERCARVVVTASYAVPSVTLPIIGGFGRTFEVIGRHSEIVDPLRAGVDAGQCGY